MDPVVPWEVARGRLKLADRGAIIELTDQEWELVADLFDPDGWRGTPAQHPRQRMVEAMLYLARTGTRWRYLPERFPPWEAVRSGWRRWRANGVWAAAMGRLARTIRADKRRYPEPSMVMLGAQTVRGGRAGPTFHDAGGRGGRTVGAKRSILVEILGLPLAVRVDPARPNDVAAARLLLADELPTLPRVRAVVADRAYRGLAKLAARRHPALDIKAPPPGASGFVPLRPLYRVEHAFAQLGRWRRLSRCHEGTAASARASLEVAAMGYLFARLRAEPARRTPVVGGSERLRAALGIPRPSWRGQPRTGSRSTPSHPPRAANVRPTPPAILSRVQVGVGRRTEFGYRP